MMDGGSSENTGPLPGSLVSTRALAVTRMHLADTEYLATKLVKLFAMISELDGEMGIPVCRALVDIRKYRALFERSRLLTRHSEKPDIISRNAHELLGLHSRLSHLYREISASEVILCEWIRERIKENKTRSYAEIVALELPPLFDPSSDILVGSIKHTEAHILHELGLERAFDFRLITKLVEADQSKVGSSRLDEMTSSINNLQVVPPKIVTALVSDINTREKNKIEKAQRLLSDSIRRILINRNTLMELGENWILNGLKNIKSFDRYENLSSIDGFFVGQSVVIVGPGPSLKESLKHLEVLANHCHIICVQHAFNALIESGITPDLVVQTDSSEWLDAYKAGLKDVHAFVFDLVSSPQLVKLASGAKLWPYVASPYKALTFSQALCVSELPILPSAGTVSHSALSLALRLGFDDIFFVGHDFSYQGNQRYDDSLRIASPIDDKSICSINTNDGCQGVSSLDLEMFRRHIEVMIKQHKRFKNQTIFRTGAKKGARINNVVYMPIEDFHLEVVKRGRAKLGWPPCDKFKNIKRGSRLRSGSRWLAETKRITEELLCRASAPDWAVTSHEVFNNLVERAVVLSRESPELSLYLRKPLIEIDEAAALCLSPARLSYLKLELCVAIHKGIDLLLGEFD